MHDIKIFRRHDINAFTGHDSGVPGKQRYQYTKSNGQTVKCEHLEQFMHESDKERFLGWRTKDMIEAFPLCNYDSVDKMLNDLGFELDQSTAHLVLQIDYLLIDQHSLQCSMEFVSDSEYDQFNLAVKQQGLAHGFKDYKIGIYYDHG